MYVPRNVEVDYLQARILATQKTPTELISEMIRDKIDITN